MKTYEDKDESWFMIVITLIPAIVRELLRSDGSTPSKKPQKQPKVWFAWLSPAPGPGVGHNPS